MSKKITLILSFGFCSLFVSAQIGSVSTWSKTNNNPSPMDGTGSLGQTYNVTACGLNYVQASVMTTTRYSQPGTGFPTTLPISGLPSCQTIDKAYLWYIASYQSGTAPSTVVNITNPSLATFNINAAIIGTGPSKCWGETGTAVYRADVTAAISGNGNYSVNLTGFTNLNWEVDGVTLFIIYKNTSAPYQGTLVIDDGDIIGIGSISSQTMSNVNACGNSFYASAFNIVSDMQNNIAPSHPAMLNGVTSQQPNTFWSFDQALTSVNALQSTANYDEDGNNSDCYCWAVMGLYFQTVTCATCPVPSSPVSVNAQQTTSTTCNVANGSATANATGGTAPYTYVWSTNPPQTNQTATGLAAGTYTVFVSDNTGCNFATDTVLIVSSNGVSISASSTNILCGNNTNGTATSTITGGQSPFTFLWSNGATTQNLTGLGAGSYTVTVTDANGCTSTAVVTVSGPTAISSSITATAVLCNGGNNGTGTLVVTGGTGPYTYAWAPSGGTNSSATGLSAGTYTVTVTDANGCTITQNVVITQPQPININIVSTNVLCNGGNNGSATATASGGSSPYGYAWNTSPPQNTQTAAGLIAGTYIISVLDANGCQRLDTVVIDQPPIPTDTLVIRASFCEGDSIGTLNAPNVNGPFQWYYDTTAIPNATTNILVIIPANMGHYTVTWYLNGCKRRTSVKTMTAPGPYFLPDTTANVFTPNGDGRNEIFYPYQSKLYTSTTIEYYAKEFSMMIYDRWGNMVYETHDYKPQWDGKINGKEASAGVYYWISSYVSRCGPDNAPVINKGFVHLLR